MSAAVLRAQTPSVIQPLFVQASSAQTTSPVNNVGQIGHSAVLIFTNAAAHTCTTPAGTAQLEYSFDNSTYYAFGTPQTNVSAGLTQSYSGSGLFTYVRFHLTSFDTTNCVATAYYAGAGYTSTTVNQIVGCDRSASGTVAGASTSSTVVAAPSLGAIHVCFAAVTLPTTTGSVEFGQGGGAGGNCSAIGTLSMQPMNVLANTTLPIGSGLGNLFTQPPTAPLCILGTQANLAWLVSYSIY